MRRLYITVFCILLLSVPASALEISPPEVPKSGAELMPENTGSLADGLIQLTQNAIKRLFPDLSEAWNICARLLCGTLCLSFLQSFSGQARRSVETAAVVLIMGLLLEGTNSLIHLGAETVIELSEYTKLLLPVMTAALAAQGLAGSSAILYGGTAAFDMILSSLISKLLVPLVYAFLALSAANSASGQDILKKLRDFIKWIISWSLKTVVTIYTAYMSISGVVSGTTDAAALKAARMTISNVVPVVGGILSDASEAVLVSAQLVKNAAGIYGIIAILAVFLGPFLQISIHYLLLKLTTALCGMFGIKQVTELIEDFSSAMGFLLAMTGASCLLSLISTICFLKGAA